MSHFYAIIQGNRGAATRTGHKSSGITAIAQGWDLGVKVEAYHENGKDKFRITRTGGANGTVEDQEVFVVEG